MASSDRKALVGVNDLLLAASTLFMLHKTRSRSHRCFLMPSKRLRKKFSFHSKRSTRIDRKTIKRNSSGICFQLSRISNEFARLTPPKSFDAANVPSRAVTCVDDVVVLVLTIVFDFIASTPIHCSKRAYATVLVSNLWHCSRNFGFSHLITFVFRLLALLIEFSSSHVNLNYQKKGIRKCFSLSFVIGHCRVVETCELIINNNRR
jgi:hypothetical protein